MEEIIKYILDRIRFLEDEVKGAEEEIRYKDEKIKMLTQDVKDLQNLLNEYAKLATHHGTEDGYSYEWYSLHVDSDNKALFAELAGRKNDDTTEH